MAMSDKWRQKFIEREMRSCKHFNGIQKTACNAGVNYRELVGGDNYGWARRLPCYGPDGKFVDVANVCACSLFETPTLAEVEAEADEIDKSVDNTIKARAAITDHLRADGKPLRNVSGRIPCPICNSGTLGFSIAYNGHCHATCSTTGCVSWME